MEGKLVNTLPKDPLLYGLDSFPDTVLSILRSLIIRPGQSENSSDRLTTWMIPTVEVINEFSATIGGAVGLVSLTEIEVISDRSAPDLPSDIYFQRHIRPWG